MLNDSQLRSLPAVESFMTSWSLDYQIVIVCRSELSSLKPYPNAPYTSTSLYLSLEISISIELAPCPNGVRALTLTSSATFSIYHRGSSPLISENAREDITKNRCIFMIIQNNCTDIARINGISPVIQDASLSAEPRFPTR